MLVVGHLKERHLSCDIRCDRSSPLGNPFELISEEFRDEVIDCWEKYLKLVIRRNNAGMGDQFVDPREISKLITISKTWKQPNAKTIIFHLHELVPLYQEKTVYRLMCWCRKSTSLDSEPKCHCDVIIRCIAKWSSRC